MINFKLSLYCSDVELYALGFKHYKDHSSDFYYILEADCDDLYDFSITCSLIDRHIDFLRLTPKVIDVLCDLIYYGLIQKEK